MADISTQDDNITSESGHESPYTSLFHAIQLGIKHP